MRKRRQQKTHQNYLSGGKFQHILEKKYGLKIDKKTLVHALASPSDTEPVVLERVPLQKQKLIVKEKPKKKEQGRHSYLHKLHLRQAQRVG